MATKLRTPYNAISTRPTFTVPVSTKVEETQVLNAAGGYVYSVSPMHQLERFLVLGTVGGTYYASEQKLTRDNVKVIEKLIETDGPAVVAKVVEFSVGNRAPKTDPGLFVLALCASIGDRATKAAVKDALPQVARIPTHLFAFIEFVTAQRGWGRSLREMIANWYTSKDAKFLAYGLSKYQSRNGWSNRDLLRLSHAKTTDKAVNDVLHYAVKGWDSIGPDVPTEPHLVHLWAVEKAKKNTNAKEIIRLIIDYGLVREEIPTEYLKNPAVWEALLQKMPMTAMIRNLVTMSRVGLLVPMSAAGKTVTEKLVNPELLRKAHIHPIQLLSALRVYSQGGIAGAYSRSTNNTRFEVMPQIEAALDKAFELSFGFVEPTGKRTLLALDVSGSMGMGEVAGVPGLSPREATAAMAMVTARSEWSSGNVSYPLYHSVAFNHELTPFPIAPNESIKAITERMRQQRFGGTDCSLPMVYALKNKVAVDTFVIYTDNETWMGAHPPSTLEKYRQATGIDSKLIVVGMTATESSIAKQDVGHMLDVVGFDSAAPSIISQFSQGKL